MPMYNHSDDVVDPDSVPRPVMAVGAAGGPKIITAVIEAIVNRLDRGMELGEALESPRFHHQWSPDELMVERAMPAEIVASLKARGHVVVETGNLATAQGVAVGSGGRLE